MIDNIAAPSSPDLSSDLDADSDQPKTLTLTPDQLDSLSLGEPVEGQVFKIELKYNSMAAPDDNGEPDAGDPTAPAMDGAGPTDAGKTFTVVSSTTTTPPDSDADAGAANEVPGNAPDEDASPEEKVLGFKRPVKPMRPGLPPTLGMRNH